MKRPSKNIETGMTPAEALDFVTAFVSDHHHPFYLNNILFQLMAACNGNTEPFAGDINEMQHAMAVVGDLVKLNCAVYTLYEG